MAGDMTLCAPREPRDIFRDEHGLTTAGMAVSLSLCLVLVFSGAQLYRVGSASSEIQEVADVAVLAAESEVAEFMIAVKVCDAAVLSLTLLAATVYGLGVVCACVPPLKALSQQLISLAKRITDARDRFYDTATTGLNELQRMLPFLAAASASSVAASNNHGAMEASYSAVAVLVPQQGTTIGAAPDTSLAELDGEVDGNIDGIYEDAAKVEELSEKVDEAKMRGYASDCGNNPSRCMYERAERLAGLSGARNPSYSSVDAWSFQVAIDRAREYYKKRKGGSDLASGSVADRASYNLRMIFYEYAYSELKNAHFTETPLADGSSGVSGEMPKLYRNVNEFRGTQLYHEAVLPVSDGVMHAYSGCPAIASATSYASAAVFEGGAYTGCETCGFSIESIGNIASATTNVVTGFEHHYEKVRQASEDYKGAVNELAPLKDAVKGKVSPILDAVSEVISNAATNRISAEPPGNKGAIAMVVNTASNPADTGFESMFVGGGAVLGLRAAVSGASLLEDSSHDNGSVVTSLLDGFEGGGGAAVGAARIALDCWSALLNVYERGHDALTGALEDGLNSIPVVSAGGLGTWAAEALRSAIRSVGLEPANLKALKPAILNTGHVSGAGDDSFSVSFGQVKANALSTSCSGSIFSGIASGVSDAVTETISGAEITIAEIEFSIGEATIPIKIAVPPSAAEAAGGFVSQCLDAVAGAMSSATGMKVWQ